MIYLQLILGNRITIDDFFNLECITKVQDIQTALQQLLLFLFNKKITQKKAFLYKVL